MPIYRYRCDQCEKETEVFQGINDEPLMTCEDCGGRLRKLIGRVGIKFNGTRLLRHRREEVQLLLFGGHEDRN